MQQQASSPAVLQHVGECQSLAAGDVARLEPRPRLWRLSPPPARQRRVEAKDQGLW